MANKGIRRVCTDSSGYREDLRLLVLLSLKEEKRRGVKPNIKSVHVQYQVYFSSLILNLKTDFTYYYYLVWSYTVYDILLDLRKNGYICADHRPLTKPSFIILKNLDELIKEFPENKVKLYEKAMASTRCRDIFVSNHRIYITTIVLYLLKTFPDKDFVTYLRTLWILGWHIEAKTLKTILTYIPGGKLAGFFPKNKIKSGFENIKPRKIQDWNF